MRRYFYSKGQEKEGPVTLEQLKEMGIQPKTLIWHEGLEDWKEALDIEELKELFELSPPPLDPKTNPLINQTNDNLEAKEQSDRNPKPLKKQSLFSNPFSFKGRIRRLEFGLSLILFCFFVIVSGALIQQGVSFGRLIHPLITWFLFAQGTKRCHDLSKSGWNLLIPFFIIFLIFEDGAQGNNKYGRNPK